LDTNIVLQHNLIDSFYNYGIYGYYLRAPILTSNTINDIGTYTNPFGIYLNYCYDSFNVSLNQIFDERNSQSQGINLNYCYGSSSAKGKVINNFVNVNAGNSNNIALTDMYGTYHNIYNNT